MERNGNPLDNNDAMHSNAQQCTVYNSGIGFHTFKYTAVGDEPTIHLELKRMHREMGEWREEGGESEGVSRRLSAFYHTHLRLVQE